MAQGLYTTQEIRLITGTAQRTQDRWLKKGNLAPVERGVGRGKPHLFDKACGVWAMALDEIFSLWPRTKSKCEVYLDFVSTTSHRHPPSQGPFSLEDGERILNYIREQEQRQSNYPHPFGLIVQILNGNKGHFLNPSSERSVEIHITPIERALDDIGRFLANPIMPVFENQAGDEIKSISGISLARLSRRFDLQRDMLKI